MSESVLPPSFVAAIRRNLPLLSHEVPITENLDLAAAGLDSLAMVSLLAEVEEEFAVTIPDDQLDMRTFATPGSLWAAISRLSPQAGASQTEHP